MDNTKKLMFGIDYINRTINFNLSFQIVCSKMLSNISFESILSRLKVQLLKI